MLENEKLVCEFLHVFSCFEYALKTTSFLTSRNKGDAFADWEKFSNSIDSENKLAEVKSVEFNKGVKYFFENPPKKQIVDNGFLGWEEYKKPEHFNNFKELLKLVRRVRNNLFHGGKFRSGLEQGSERNSNLLKYGLVILKECIDLNKEIKEKFNEQFKNISEAFKYDELWNVDNGSVLCKECHTKMESSKHYNLNN